MTNKKTNSYHQPLTRKSCFSRNKMGSNTNTPAMAEHRTYDSVLHLATGLSRFYLGTASPAARHCPLDIKARHTRGLGVKPTSHLAQY